MPENNTTPGEFRIGRTVAGRYRVISKLGEGGMGITYRAWDERESRPVVLKMPRHTLFGNPAFAERFRREVRMMAALSHPSIVPILDVGDEQGLPFLTMRFLPGGSLSNRRLRDADGKVLQMQPSTLHLWLRAVASALDFVHSNGIVHRDVKPANIFFDSYWGAYLGDFGIAKIVEDTTVLEKEQTLTATSMAIGTQEYMAPEQFTPKAVVDGRVDQYALAVMVYEILCGQRPFKGDSAHLIVEVTTQPVPRVTDFRRDLPESLCRALYKGLAKTPEERFANCSGFAAAVLHDVRPMADEEGVARLLCPQCGNMLKMPPSAAGRQGKCPRCKTEMMVAGDMTAVWLAREERKACESGSAYTAGRTVDKDDVFTSISSETVTTKPASGGFLSQLSPTVQRFGIGAVALTCFVTGALLGGDHAGSEARDQLDAATAKQRKLLEESKHLRKEVESLTEANLKLRRELETRAAQNPQPEEQAADAGPVSRSLSEAETPAPAAVNNSVDRGGIENDAIITRQYAIPGFPSGPWDNEGQSVALVTTSIRPMTWSNVGGPAYAGSSGKGLVTVKHTADVHSLVDSLFTTLRAIMAQGRNHRGRMANANDAHFVIGECGGKGEDDLPLILVVYDVSDIVSFDVEGNLHTLIASLQKDITPDQWNVIGGPANIQPFAAASCLAIRQTSPAHAAIRTYLKTARDAVTR
jgi:tRNA A-37 threonylcarbamoyl transferase component Bud32